MSTLAPDELHLDYDGDTIQYEEAFDLERIPPEQREGFKQRTVDSVRASGIPLDGIETSEEDRWFRIAWEAEGDGHQAVAVAAAEFLLKLDNLNGDVDRLYHAVKAQGFKGLLE